MILQDSLFVVVVVVVVGTHEALAVVVMFQIIRHMMDTKVCQHGSGADYSVSLEFVCLSM